MFEHLFLVSLSVATLQVPTQDPEPALRSAAARAAFRYESRLRRRAPSRLPGGAGTDCDEFIGRFCFHFLDADMEREPPDTTAEDPAIVEARRRAISTHRAWLSHRPQDPDAAGPLVRYLVESDRPGEAVAAARTHAWAAERSPASLLLLGLALHESGSFGAAESVFDSARSRLPVGERRRLDDVGVLLEPEERRVYHDRTPDERTPYNRRFWRLADPSLLEPGNERRSAHYARHAWAPILEGAPRVAGRPTWGSDTEEILIRYGLPTRRERVRETRLRARTELSIVEIYDARALSFVPARLRTEGIPSAPDPGVEPVVERRVARSAYTRVLAPRTRGLSVQAARFPSDSGWVLVVSGLLEPDSAAPPASPEGLLVVMDTMGHEVGRRPTRIHTVESGVRVWGEVRVGPGAWVYRLEVDDEATGRAGLAQYRIDVEAAGQPAISDLLVASPLAAAESSPVSRSALHPLGRLVLEPGSRPLVWAEVAGLSRQGGEARYEVEWWVESKERPGPIGRAVRWLGRQLGVAEDEEPVRVRWDDRSRQNPVPVRFTVDFGGLEPGLYRLRLRVRDSITGRAATSARLVRLDPASRRDRQGRD